jgi:quercetin dioxygenase-like cupin family protein
MSSPDLDALVAAPRHHRLAYEDDRVRVLETIVLPGETTPLHTHSWPGTLYVLGGSEFIRRDAQGVVLVDSRSAGVCLEAGQAFWTGPLGPHTLENVGETPIHIIATEVKMPSGSI